MIDELLEWLKVTDGPLPYVVLALSGALEYVLPFLPGDTVMLFGAFLCTTAGRDPLLVYGAINLGSLAGAMAAYAAGRALASRQHLVKRTRLRLAIELAEERFARHGAAYLLVNRFVPAARAVFFLAAGMVRMPPWKVLLFGGLSALAWNALIVAVAWSIGGSWEQLQGWFRRYTHVALAAFALAVLVVAWRWSRVVLRPGVGPAPPGEGPPTE